VKKQPLTLIGLLLFAGLLTLAAWMLKPFGEAAGSIAGWLQGEKRITTTFTSQLELLEKRTLLQVASLDKTVTFEKRENHGWKFWDWSGEAVVKISAPVSYRYYLDLNGEWQFERRAGVLLVRPPGFIKPDVVIHTEGLKASVEKTCGQAWEDQMLIELARSMSARCDGDAIKDVNVIRGVAAEGVEDFVRTWVRSFDDGSDYVVKIEWPDEMKSLQ
jgi:hypothetical protein